MFNYAGMEATATALINHFGADTTITRTGGATFNPGTGSYTGGSVTTLTGKGVRMRFDNSEIDGEIVKRGDFRLLFGAASGAPEVDDNVEFSSNDYRAMQVKATSPAGTAVMYDIHCRR